MEEYFTLASWQRVRRAAQKHATPRDQACNITLLFSNENEQGLSGSQTTDPALSTFATLEPRGTRTTQRLHLRKQVQPCKAK